MYMYLVHNKEPFKLLNSQLFFVHVHVFTKMLLIVLKHNVADQMDENKLPISCPIILSIT